MQKKIDEDFSTICICAERYALGRQTYMPSLVQDYIRKHIAEIDLRAMKVMLRDVREAENMGYGYGDDKIDKPGWLAFADFLSAEIERRGIDEQIS